MVANMTKIRFISFLLIVASGVVSTGLAELLIVRGTPVTGLPVAAVTSDLKREHGIEFKVVIEGGSAAGIAGVGQEVVDVGLSTRPISGEERAAFPDKRFTETKIGSQAVMVVVSEDLWQAGIRRLSKKQLILIYERRLKNWKELGGPDREIIFYNRPGVNAGRGVWDVFVIWLYDDVRKAPLSKSETLQTSEEVRDSVEFNTGAISLLEYSEMPKAGVRALSVELDNGNIVDPSLENISAGKYPLSRPLILVNLGKPNGAVKKMIDFMLSEKGQAAVKRAGHAPLAQPQNQ
jgi:phosphate transport system substrate-binding protein